MEVFLKENEIGNLTCLYDPIHCSYICRI